MSHLLINIHLSLSLFGYLIKVATCSEICYHSTSDLNNDFEKLNKNNEFVLVCGRMKLDYFLENRILRKEWGETLNRQQLLRRGSKNYDELW